MLARVTAFCLPALFTAEIAAQEPIRRPADPLTLVRRIHLRLNDRVPNSKEFDIILRQADISSLTKRLIKTSAFLEVREKLWADWLGVRDRPYQERLHTTILEEPCVDRRLDKWFTWYQPIAETDSEAFTILETIGPGLIGSGMKCTRCHDHPFEKASQDEFLTFSGWFRSGGVIAQPETVYVGKEPGEEIEAGIPKRFGKMPPRRFGEPFPGLEKRKIPDERKIISQFANWVSGFPVNERTERLVLARYLTHFTGNESFLDETEKQNRNGSSSDILDDWIKHWRAVEYDEKSLIRAIVNSPEFHEATPNSSFVRQTVMTQKVWKRSVLAVLDIKDSDTIPKLPDDTFVQKSLFLDMLLQEPGSLPDEVDWEMVWPRALGRKISPAERDALNGINARDIYHSLFLSDDFSLIR